MGYVFAAYLIVLGAMGFYWWTLQSRTARLRREMPPEAPPGAPEAPPGASEAPPGAGDGEQGG